jgi:hypothetical protein
LRHAGCSRVATAGASGPNRYKSTWTNEDALAADPADSHAADAGRRLVDEQREDAVLRALDGAGERRRLDCHAPRELSRYCSSTGPVVPFNEGSTPRRGRDAVRASSRG